MSFFNYSPPSHSGSPPSSYSSPLFPNTTTATGLSYGVAIAVAILVFISIIMLTSYLCLRIACVGTPPDPPLAEQTSLSSTIVVIAPGLDEATIASYPKHCFSLSLSGADADSTCAICLADYHPGDTLRQIPDCRHSFHADCIDAWLIKSPTCPVCRTSPVPTPLATPLSELVPLASHRR